MPNVAKIKTEYPVSLKDAKRHLRINTVDNNDDGYIVNVIKAATREAENYIGKDICLTSNVASIFDYSGDTIRFDEGNLINVTSVISDASVSLPIAVTKQFYNYFEIHLVNSVSSTSKTIPLTVNYVTGFTETTCPEEIKQAILIKIANMYDINREDATPNFLKDGLASNNLLNPHKLISF